MLHHHPFVLVHLQHCSQAARKAPQVRHHPGVQEQAEVLPQQKRSQADRDDAGDLLMLHRVLPSANARECFRREDDAVSIRTRSGVNRRMEFSGYKSNYLCSRQLAVPQRLQKPLRANQNVEKFK